METVSLHGIINSFTDEYAFLSNFYPVPGGITVGKHTFLSVEHAYQAFKCPEELRDERWYSYKIKNLKKVLDLREKGTILHKY